MPTLTQLKTKWFIGMDGTSPDGVPWRRHTNPGGIHSLNISTDGNIVTPLIDGRSFMKSWHDNVIALHGAPNSELYLSAWRLEDVKTLGESDQTSDARMILDAADENGVFVRVLLSNHATCLKFNVPSWAWLNGHGVITMLDDRFPTVGSNHFKYTVMKQQGSFNALLGSIDLSKSRWDEPDHLATNPNRAIRGKFQGNPTHDTGVLLQGPVVRDLELAFRERWNDQPGIYSILPSITTPVSNPPSIGNHSVQVLRTYGITVNNAYSWSPRGEFTIWASYLNAIKNATTYIYIEDQYFVPFDWPPAFAITNTSASNIARDTDLFFQLGQAMFRGVRIFVLVPSNSEDELKRIPKYQRDIGINYLRMIKDYGATGEVIVASLQNGSEDVYVHSKLMIVDDELILIGSANFSQRSMTCDGELQVAIVDEANLIARELRIALWSEHLGQAVNLDDPIAAYQILASGVSNQSGHLKPYTHDTRALWPPTSNSQRPDTGHSTIIRNIFDPYYGPQSIR